VTGDYPPVHQISSIQRIFLLYYSIIKDQFTTSRTYVLSNSFKLFETITQLVGSFWSLSSDFRLLTLVEVNGIEPMASCVQGRRSPS
jgi:hypothetical protein